jgi:hypothetical protein
MKAKSSIIGFAAMLFATAWTAPTPMVLSEGIGTRANQETETAFAFVRLQVQAGRVTAAWGVVAADDIEGFVVQKTSGDPGDENTYWKDVTTIANDGSSSYKFTDPKYAKKESNYRILALRTDNTSIVSDVMLAPTTELRRD